MTTNKNNSYKLSIVCQSNNIINNYRFALFKDIYISK